MGLYLDIARKTAEIEQSSNENDKDIPIEKNKKPSPKDQAVKIYSKILDAYLWVVLDDNLIQELIDEGITEPIYTAGDIRKLRKLKKLKQLPEDNLKEKLSVIHRAKEILPGSTIEDISQK